MPRALAAMVSHGKFEEAALTAVPSGSPDFVDVMIHACAPAFGGAAGDPACEALAERPAAGPGSLGPP